MPNTTLLTPVPFARGAFTGSRYDIYAVQELSWRAIKPSKTLLAHIKENDMPMVTNLVDYISAVQSVCRPTLAFKSTTTHWFRGQSNSSWDLVPSLYRGKIDPGRERELTRDFILRSSRYLSANPDNKLEWRFIMQHCGLPTRLLDWTESHLVALYFSVFNFDETTDAAVWILHPWSLNDKTISLKSVPVITDDIVEKYAFNMASSPNIKAEMHVAVRPRHTSDRIIAQKGQFTIHGHDKAGINNLAKNRLKDIEISVINIDGRFKKTILKELCMAGITHSVLFPDLDGLSKEVYLRYSNEFMS